MKIAMFASEVLPFSKTGGLADVAYSLSKELARSKNQVIVCTPYYAKCRLGELKPKYIGSYNVTMSWRNLEAKVSEVEVEGIKFYLIANAYYFDRPNIYGYHDDCERFAFFSLASLKLLEFIAFQADVIHVHDWQAAMVPCLLKKGNLSGFYKEMKSVLTIHNPAFKGMMDRYFLNNFYGLDDYLYDSGEVRFDNFVSTLKSGIVFADKVTTVSPSHKDELLDAYSDQRLNGVLSLRNGDFVGILNGIDVDEWNPATDRNIAKTYSLNERGGKKDCQEDLLKTFNLSKGKGPLFGVVSRLSWQKGIDLILEALPSFVKEGCSFVILGSGEYGLEQKCQAARNQFPDKVGIYIGYNDVLSHKIYAGCDFFLMPSLFEPCGISQMISLRYGTLPVVRYTGGLRDTVNGYDGENIKVADGIGFNDYDVGGISYGLSLACEIYSESGVFDRIVGNAMRKDNSWKKSAKAYLELYHEICK